MGKFLRDLGPGSVTSKFGFGFLVACLGNGLLSVAPPPSPGSS